MKGIENFKSTKRPEQMGLGEDRKLASFSEEELSDLRASIFAKRINGEKLTPLERELERKEIDESRDEYWKSPS